MKMPAIFFGHGNPMNALEDNRYTREWQQIGAALPRPKAILSISAHWYVPGTFVTAAPAPRTIHDLGGFPRELYQVQYPAPGDPELASRVLQLLAPLVLAKSDLQWGLDHGTWSVLTHVFPRADVPVIQLSIDETKAPQFHFRAGKQLAQLRDNGVLLVGSGNVVHNLHAFAWGRHPVEPFDWAERFETHVRGAISAGQDETLVDYEDLGRDALLCVPTPDHYLPLLYILGARDSGDTVSFPVQGIDGGSVSMLAVRFG